MKLSKFVAIVAVISLFVVGTVFAMEPEQGFMRRSNAANNSEMAKPNFAVQNRQAKTPQNQDGNSASIIAEITGLSKDEIASLCQDLRDEGKTIVDYLKENNLFEKWKTKLLDLTEEKLSILLENEKITEDMIPDILDKVEEKLEDAPPLKLNIGSSINGKNNGYGRNQRGSFEGMRGNRQNCPYSESTTPNPTA